MKPSTWIVAALLVALPVSCKSSSSDSSSTSSSPSGSPARSDATAACNCGTPLGDLEGCAHPACMAGKNNPDNPDCVCGTIEIPAAKEKK